jgi:anti-anti-sigma factor
VHDTKVRSGSTRSPLFGEPASGGALDRDDRGAALVRLAGELNLATAPRLAQVLCEATRRARLIVVDLRGLTRVDTAGVGAILDASRSARRDRRRLVLVRGLSQVERLLALSGASDGVEIVDLAAGEPTINALLQFAHYDSADTRQQVNAPWRISTFGVGQIGRGVDALIERVARHDFIDGRDSRI